MENRINVLLNAYAVSPNWGSEPGLGWNWIIGLAKYCNIYVITEGECKGEIETALENHPLKENIHFFYLSVSPKIRQMCWNQGDWRFYYFYRQWQNQALDLARQIVRTHRIDIIHQLNMIGYREPGSLWKIDNIPFVWGPVGGYGWTTLNYLKGQSFKSKFKIISKNLINGLQARLYPLPKKAMKKAKCVFAANSKVYNYIKEHFRTDVILLNETGCYEKNVPIKKKESSIFNILWVGKFDYRKQLDLALYTLSLLKHSCSNVKLNIIGDKNIKGFNRLIDLTKSLDIEDNVEWYGKIPNSQVLQIMQESDILLFTSIDEGTPHVVLEAIQNNLPVVCFDTCGQGDVVTSSIGITVPLSNSRRSPEDFASAIFSLITNPKRLTTMRENCRLRQRDLTWDSKMKIVVREYRKILGNLS